MDTNNMYTYCLNNPVNLDDQDGNAPKWLKKIVKKVVKTATKIVKKAASTAKKIISAGRKALSRLNRTISKGLNLMALRRMIKW